MRFAKSEGVNEIPAALAELLSEWLSLSIIDSIVQSNTVGHTGASGFQRLANQALFVGDVESGRSYLLVDDFIGQGGTLAGTVKSGTSRPCSNGVNSVKRLRFVRLPTRASAGKPRVLSINIQHTRRLPVGA